MKLKDLTIIERKLKAETELKNIGFSVYNIIRTKYSILPQGYSPDG